MPPGTPHRFPTVGAFAEDAVHVVVAATAESRAPMRAALSRAGLIVDAEAISARDAVTSTVRARARACLLDAALPGDRTWAIRTIHAALPETVVILFATEASDDDITDAVRAGAAGYLTGLSAADTAAEAVRMALWGHAALPRDTVARLARRARWLRPPALQAPGAADLSPREREVLEALLDGATTAEIAAALGLSAVTVRRHVSGVVRKLGGSSREALLLAGEGGTPAPTAPARNRAPLSAREVGVLRLAAAGWSNRAIADELFITPSTVKNHLTRIMAKLGARNRTEAAVLAARHGDL